jgi:hypothetical protein
MRARQSTISALGKELRDRDKVLEDFAAAIVREHLREEAELEDEEDGTRSPRRNVFQRVNESREENLANM